jgi:hypothetical protein
LLHQRLRLFYHKAGLVPFVKGLIIGNLVAVRIIGPQFLGFAARIILNHRVGRVQDDAGGTVVLLQLQEPGLGKIFFKVQDVADIRTPPAVNALVRVAHHAQVVVLGGQHLVKTYWAWLVSWYSSTRI